MDTSRITKIKDMLHKHILNSLMISKGEKVLKIIRINMVQTKDITKIHIMMKEVVMTTVSTPMMVFIVQHHIMI